MTRILTEADSLADLNGTPRPGDLPPLPNAFATLHHDDGYFTMPSRNESMRRPFRTNAYTAEQMTTYGQACAAQSAARIEELERANAALGHELIKVAAWLLSPEPRYKLAALEDARQIGR